MYVKVENGEAKVFPYSVAKLRSDNPLVSFPKVVSEAILSEYGIYPVVTRKVESFDQATQAVVPAKLPVLIGDEWVLEDVVVEKSQVEIDRYIENAKTTVRRQRNSKLAACDWTQVSDAPVDQAAWATYRQALRDITTQEGFPLSIEWPTQP